MSAFEAASCGLPIVVSNNVKERIQYGNGLCVEEENHKEISNAIKKLLLSSSLRKKMGEKGRKLVKDKFSYDVIAKDVPYVFLYYPESLVGMNTRVQGLSPAGPAGFLNPIEAIYLQE